MKILKKDCKIVLKRTGEKEYVLVLENTGIKDILKNYSYIFRER